MKTNTIGAFIAGIAAVIALVAALVFLANRKPPVKPGRSDAWGAAHFDAMKKLEDSFRGKGKSQ